MTGALRLATLLLALLALRPSPAGAQGRDPLAGAIAAYRALDLDVSAARLRELLAPDAPSPLATSDSLRALMYLGATEHYRGRRAEALDAFRVIVARDPRYRPDALTFPPEVAAVFAEARRTVAAVLVAAPDAIELGGPGETIPFRLTVTGPHEVRAMMRDPQGIPLRLLWQGAIADTLTVAWDARDARGRALGDGTYALEVTSRDAGGAVVRAVELPVLVERIGQDTLPTPRLEPSALRPEARRERRPLRVIGYGLLAAGAAVALPNAIEDRSAGRSTAAVVGVALGAAAIAEFLGGGRRVPVPENVAWNQRVREEHAREVARAAEENARRAAGVALRLRTGVPVSVSPR